MSDVLQQVSDALADTAAAVSTGVVRVEARRRLAATGIVWSPDGVIVTAHCENETLITELQQKLLAAGETGTQWHEPSRPVRVEAEGVHHLMTFAEMTGAHVYVVVRHDHKLGVGELTQI